MNYDHRLIVPAIPRPSHSPRSSHTLSVGIRHPGRDRDRPPPPGVANHGVHLARLALRHQRPRAAHRHDDDGDPSQRHHKAYVDNLNKALEAAADLQTKPIVELLREIKRCRRRFARPSSTTAAATPITPCSGKSWAGRRRRTDGPLADDIKASLRRLRHVQGQGQEKRP